MDYDLQPWIQKQKAKLLEGLREKSAPRARLVSEPELGVRREVLRIVLAVLSFALGFSVLVVLLRLDPETTSNGLVFFPLFAAAFLPMAAAAFIWLRLLSLPDTIARRIWATPLSPDDAKRLASWTMQYPAVRELCVRWAASRPAAILTSRDFVHIARVGDKLDNLDAQLREHEKNLATASSLLEEGAPGILDEIRTSAQANTLGAATIPAAGLPSRPRL